ncbi:hypothetical protein [Bradyrhizobium sp. CW1]|uniref:hypothetical protein n=1 Tax=Bradyrhizobium sp. CW1 TaxID=2782686 RepID=UPI001FFE3C7D|nr:hypothetical protein [Bradyrhizobium sp. CW1]UPJ30300.1 hypothetical protein IVB54_15430 [Bradyrhizobium sp. CW1]
MAGNQMILCSPWKNDERRARDEAKEAVHKVRLEAELLRSAIAETRARIEESRELLARASRVKRPLAPLAEAH